MREGGVTLPHELHCNTLSLVLLFTLDHHLPPCTDKRIAVEVDGPFHFSVNTNSPLGQTMIRRRLLRAVGWTVISVPYHTW